jgi:carbon storage regulator CsrA
MERIPGMLVLSRRPAEKLLFPAFNVTVEVLSIKSNQVRLGIEAPPAVIVLRGELRPRTERPRTPPPGREADPVHPGHLVRDRLNNLVLGIALMRRQVQAGLNAGALATLEQMETELDLLRRQLNVLRDDPTEMTAMSP